MSHEVYKHNGKVYRQQYRKCGKARCKLCNDSSSYGHGPYWYETDQDTGKRRYVGKELPPDVQQAREQSKTIWRLSRQIADQHRSLERLTSGARLDRHDADVLRGLGIELHGLYPYPPTIDALMRHIWGTSSEADEEQLDRDPNARWSLTREPLSCVPASNAGTQDREP
jgi:hypothetical protein